MNFMPEFKAQLIETIETIKSSTNDVDIQAFCNKALDGIDRNIPECVISIYLIRNMLNGEGLEYTKAKIKSIVTDYNEMRMKMNEDL